MKTLFFIRHGIAEHNILFNVVGKQIFYDKRYYDTKLTMEGNDQSIQLGEKIKNENFQGIELVLTSSLTRTLQTTSNIFKGFKKPIIALDILKEYPQGLQTINKRNNKNDLEKLFPNIDFSYLNDNEDKMWNPEREESMKELHDRINQFNKILCSFNESKIAIVGHGAFIGQYKDNKICLLENGDKELLHCHPYMYTFDENRI